MCNCRQIIRQWLEPNVGNNTMCVRESEREGERKKDANRCHITRAEYDVDDRLFYQIVESNAGTRRNFSCEWNSLRRLTKYRPVVSPKITNAQQHRRQSKRPNSSLLSRFFSQTHSQTDLVIQKWPLYCDSRLSYIVLICWTTYSVALAASFWIGFAREKCSIKVIGVE